MSDSEYDEVDITSALIPSSKKRKRDASDDDDEEEAELFASLASMTRSKNLSEGAAMLKQTSKAMNKKLTGGGSFQSMGLPPVLLKALLQRGFSTPTPIQRSALPSILDNAESTVVDGKKVVIARDHVCMARTGSGKTLCYILPLLARLVSHDTRYGARALVLVPTRELAMQVLKVGKDLGRAFKGEGEPLRWAMIVGGESLEEQFEMIAGNPDVIIATPGRLLHLIVEMSLELKAVQYCVFDEADRLFELGFDQQLHEILHKLPPTRQTLLFSATLPSSLVGFAKAGLTNPKLIRLDVESKISKDLQMAFLSVKDTEKEAALLSVLREVIQVPVMSDAQRAAQRRADLRENEQHANGRHPNGSNQRKGKKMMPDQEDANVSAHQTVVFVSTKHHVESISHLLMLSGYSVSSIYGSMDQVARILSLNNFRAGRTSILVVTDLAARGIDVPGVENVINFGFPNGPRSFIHRVGRTARAGRRGWAYTILLQHELPHLLDLELFLSRPLKTCPLPENERADYANTLVLGTIPRAILDSDIETFRNLCSIDDALPTLLQVAARGQKLYEKGVSKASAESYRRAKLLVTKGGGDGLASAASDRTKHAIFANTSSPKYALPAASRTTRVDTEESAKKREEMLRLVSGFRPAETVFEIGSRGKSQGAQLMRERRKALGKAVEARKRDLDTDDDDDDSDQEVDSKEAAEPSTTTLSTLEQADEEEVEAVFGPSKKKAKTSSSFADPRFYMGYEQEGANTERGLSLSNGGDSFASDAARVQYDVAATKGDTEGTPAEMLAQRASLLRWDRKQKKFVKGDGTGSDNKKLIKSESGQRLPASFKAGVYEDWKKKQRVYVPRVGEQEIKGKTVDAGLRKYRHKGGMPKAGTDDSHDGAGGGKKKRRVGKPEKPGTAPGGLKNAAQIRKERVQKAKRVKRSTQPGKKQRGSK